MLAWVWVGGVQHAMAQQVPDTNASAAEATPSLADTEKRMAPYFNALESLRKNIPSETFDVAAVAAGIGKDPQAILAWVADHTAWVPYHGALRGPTGVLMDRRGDGLDRATLLAELLRTQGYAVRLAQADLPADAVAKITTGLTYTPKTPLPPVVLADESSADTFAKQYGQPFGLDPVKLKQQTQALIANSQKATEEIVSRTTQQTATLAQMVLKAAPAANAANAAQPDVAGCLADHWWVQVSDGGTWTDLDLDLPAGAPEPAPTQTIDWQPKDGHLPLDAKLCHEVDVRVIAEKWDGGHVTEQTALKRTLRPSEMIGQHIELRCSPLGWPANLDLANEVDPAAKLRSVVMDQHEWLPMLVINGKQNYKSSVSDTGMVNDNPDLDPTKKAGKSAGGAAGRRG